MPIRLAKTLLAAAFALAATLALCVSAFAATSSSGGTTAASGGASPPTSSGSSSGGVSPSDAQFQPTGKAKIVNGMAVPPADAPKEIVDAINAANSIAGMPYRYGGGHKTTFVDAGYDCSGSVSYLLHGGGLLDSPLDSSSFMKWGEAGKGKWITVYTNPGHAFVVIAGLRFDTGYRDNTIRGIAPGKGPRWGKKRSTRGFTARHPLGH
jgi:cell wall-associated NlpC family hydrolase